MKYIDSEKLIAALEKSQQNIDEISAKHGGKNSFRMGRQAELDSFRRIITSLQQEQKQPRGKNGNVAPSYLLKELIINQNI